MSTPLHDLLQMKVDALDDIVPLSREYEFSKHRDLTKPVLVTPQDEALRVLDGGAGLNLAKQWLALGVDTKVARGSGPLSEPHESERFAYRHSDGGR